MGAHPANWFFIVDESEAVLVSIKCQRHLATVTKPSNNRHKVHKYILLCMIHDWPLFVSIWPKNHNSDNWLLFITRLTW